MDDINDYGQFENFYRPLSEKKEEKLLWGGEELRQPEGRPSPFILDDFSVEPITP